MKSRLLALICCWPVLLAGSLRAQSGSPLNVSGDVQYGFLNWQLIRATGSLLGTLGITNPATSTVTFSIPFQLGLQSSTNFFYVHPTGTLPDGLAYVDLSAAVNTQTSDGTLQPGQFVVLTNAVEVFSRTRNPPADGMFELWAAQPSGVATVRITSPRSGWITNATQIEVDGTAGSNSLVRIEGGAVTVTNVADASGNFSVLVPLRTNAVNHLFAIATDDMGNSTAPQPLDVVQDVQAPSLFIDFPPANAELATDAIDVAGRVGDLLSGFMGLAVTVNGQSATVDVGIGNNGTFVLGNLPLTLGTNVITATATDIAGNTIIRQIAVKRVPLTGPQMVALSGNAQTTNVHRPLMNPVVVQVTETNGAPFANKIVTFTVIRSDGRLVADPSAGVAGAMMLQAHTDASGLASAYWTLGGDAGCGNNRVVVTSKDIAGSIFFCASANPARAGQINIGSGNNQRAEAGGPAGESLRAWVNDSCNGVRNIPVTFTVLQGGGRVNGSSSATVLTSATGHSQVDFTLGPDKGNNVVEANFPGNPGNPATFILYGLVRDTNTPTSFTGLILDNASQPIGNAICSLTVGGITLMTPSDAQGQFTFTNTPSGRGDLFVNGLTASSLGGSFISPNSFPFLSYSVTVVPNAENSLSLPVLLPRLNPTNNVVYRGTNDLVLTCEGMAGLKMTIKANSMRKADGTLVTPSNPAVVSLNQVHHDKVPMPIPDGAAPPFTWTLQPARSTFDPPIQIEYPNMSGLPAGSIAFFLTFNHDTEKFEIIASGHVVGDGSVIVTDAGAGLSLAGWGCNCPPYSVTANCCLATPVACAECVNGKIQNKPDGAPCDDGDPCTVNDRCQNGVCKGDKVSVQSISVVSGATQNNVTGTENWAAVKGTGDVVVEVTISPNTDEAASAITWGGGSGVPGNPRQRTVSKGTSAKTTVKASCGMSSKELNVWILWTTVENKTTGTTPANAVQYGSRYDGTEDLGAQAFNGGTEAVGKVVPIGTIIPVGVHDVVKAGWEFNREKFRHDFQDGAKDMTRYDTTWQPDTSDPSFQNLTPDTDDKIYDRDAPNINGIGATDSYERYDNYREWVVWNGTDCSAKEGWYWKAWWKADQNPQVTSKEVSAGEINPLPTTSHYPP